MKILYLLPFSYFYETRLRTSSLLFHALFEWLAAGVLVLVLGEGGPWQMLVMSGLTYLAMISLYEIGYLTNDLFASRREADGRRRGPQGVAGFWVAAWMLLRVLVFLLVTVWMGMLAAPEWWSYFSALCLVFALHNGLMDAEFKVVTFIWLAWMRFMAPVMFVVPKSQLMGIGLAAAMTYVCFRLLGYLDSKGLLEMPGRQGANFRLFFFVVPLVGALVLWPYDQAKGFVVLSVYFALVALLGTVVSGRRDVVDNAR